MNCDILAKKAQEARDAMRTATARILARGVGYEGNISKADDVRGLRDHLVNNRKWDADRLDQFLNSKPDEKDFKDMLSANEAAHEAAIKKLGEGVKNWFEDKSDWFKRQCDRSFNTRPTMNAVMDAAMKTFNAFRTSFIVGKDKFGRIVEVGSNARFRNMAEFDEVRKSQGFKDVAGVMSHKDFDLAVNMANMSRAETKDVSNLGEWAARKVKEYEANVESGTNVGQKKFIEPLKNLVTASRSKDFQGLVKKYWDTLDHLGAHAHENGIIDTPLKDYMHNLIAMQDFADPNDHFTDGIKTAYSNFRKQKKMTGVDFMDKGLTPASLSAIENMSFYSSAMARALRGGALRDVMKTNADIERMDHPDKFLIRDGDSWSPAVARMREDGTPPKTEGGSNYENLGNVNGAFNGLMAHPEFYRYMSNVYGKGAMDWLSGVRGFARGAVRLNNFVKSVDLTGGYGWASFHGVSLYSKGVLAMQSAMFRDGRVADGLLSPFRMGSLVDKGLTAVNNSDPILRKFIDGGMTLLHSDVANLSLFSTSYNTKTGDLTAMSSIKQMFNELQDTSRSKLFDQIHPGIKAGMALEIADTAWFQSLCRESGENAAYEHVADLVNNTFGGQNLEAMGRHKGLQSVLQFMILAPDWQESKIKRMFGVAANNTEIRKQYQAAVALEAAYVVLGHVALQQIVSAMSGDDSHNSIDQIAKDMWNGRLTEVYTGKQGKKEVWLKSGTALQEDFGPIVSGLKNMKEQYDDVTQGRKTIMGAVAAPGSAMFKTAQETLKNRMGPIVRPFIEPNTPEWPTPMFVQQTLSQKNPLESVLALAGSFFGVSSYARNKASERKGKTQYQKDQESESSALPR